MCSSDLIGNLSESVGSQRYGTKYRFRDRENNNFETGAILPVDLAANAESLGIDVIRISESPNAIDDLIAAIKVAKASPKATLIHINSDPLLPSPSNESWWDVPIAQVSELKSTQAALKEYQENIKKQRPLFGKGSSERNI